MSEQKIPIPARLYNAAVNGHVAGTEDIIDDDKNKTQQEINTDVDTELENHQQQLDNKYNKSEVYSKSETYNKTELNNMITTPNQEYVSVTATYQTTAVTDVLPATGEADTVYRVGNWDGSQYDTTCYTEYAWNGSAYVKLNTKEYGIDDEPTAGSDNLVKSGGVADYVVDTDDTLIMELEIETTAGVAISEIDYALDISGRIKSGEKFQYTLYDGNHVINGNNYGFLRVKNIGGAFFSQSTVFSNKSNVVTASGDIDKIGISINAGDVIGNGIIKFELKSESKEEKSIVTQKFDSTKKYAQNIGLEESESLNSAVHSLIIGGDFTKRFSERNFFHYPTYTPNVVEVNDAFLISQGLQHIDALKSAVAAGGSLALGKWSYNDNSSQADQFINEIYKLDNAGKKIRIEFYIYSAHKDFPSGSTNKIYGQLFSAPLVEVENTTSEYVKKFIFEDDVLYPETFSYIYYYVLATASADYAIGEYGMAGFKIGLWDKIEYDRTLPLLGDWEVDNLKKSVAIPRGEVINTEFYNEVNNYKDFGDNGTSFNRVEKIRDYLQLFLYRHKNKKVDVYNRLLVSFNGDSIIGSQLDDITKCAEYNTGEFPPNMSKQIMARMFWERYKYADEDVLYRNLIHSDWTKQGFAISNGKDDSSKTFNEIEVYGCNEGDYAQISVSGKNYIKFIWSEYNTLDWSFDIMQSVNGGEFTLLHTVTNSSDRKLMVAYKIFNLVSTNNYVFKIVPTSGYNDICFWGIEAWSNPRLDVVVEAVSGSTAADRIERGLDGYYSEQHKPALIITDIFAINDYSNSQDINWWIDNITALYKFIKDKGILVLSMSTHGSNYVPMGCPLLKGLGYETIDIYSKLEDVDWEPGYGKKITNNTDGLHLSDYGNEYYFEELKRVFDEVLLT